MVVVLELNEFGKVDIKIRVFFLFLFRILKEVLIVFLIELLLFLFFLSIFKGFFLRLVIS